MSVSLFTLPAALLTRTHARNALLQGWKRFREPFASIVIGALVSPVAPEEPFEGQGFRPRNGHKEVHRGTWYNDYVIKTAHDFRRP